MRKLFNESESGTLKSRLTKNALGSFGLRIATIGLAFIISVALSRLFGTEGYGVYSYAITWLFVLQIPAGLGMKALIVREVSAYRARSEWGLMRGLLGWANQAVLITSIGIAILAAFVVWILRADDSSQLLTVFWLSLISLPFFSLKLLRQATLQGLNRVVIGQLPEALIQPVLFIILLGCAYLFFGENLSVVWAMGLQVITTGIAFFIGAEMLRRNIPQAMRGTPPDYRVGIWMRSVLPFMFTNSMYVVNNRADALMLGAIKGPEAVGLYVVASRGAELISFILMAVNLSIGPTVAKLYAEGNIRKLQNLVTKSSRIIFLASLPIALALIVYGNWFLIIFGPNFVVGQQALILLSVGQLFNAGMGSVGLLLNMTGYERDTAIGVGISATLNIILNAILIPGYGLEGAATATAISTVIWNILLLVYVHRRLKVSPTAIGRINFLKK